MALSNEAVLKVSTDNVPTNSASNKNRSMSLEELRALVSSDDVHKQLRLLNEEETQLDSDLDKVMKNKAAVECSLEGLSLLE